MNSRGGYDGATSARESRAGTAPKGPRTSSTGGSGGSVPYSTSGRTSSSATGTCWSSWTDCGSTRCAISPGSAARSDRSGRSGRWESTSGEWIENTFVEEDAPLLARTGYVTANPFSTVLDRKRDDATLAYLDEVWRYGFDEDLGTVPPRVVTDRALVVDRDADIDRLVVHYMQPHQPFITDDAPLRGISTMADVVESRDRGRDEWEPGSVHANNVWYMLATGEVSSEELLASYRANLELVLEEVQLLLENLATDCVAITADHGNAAGEWWMYGHPRGFLHPVVRTVPWIETEGRGPGEYEPASRREDVDTDVTNVLTALGYHQ